VPRFDVTIAIPALNEADNLPRTLETVAEAGRRAGLSALEILVVDDGSTDGTGAIADAAATHDPSLRVIRHSRNLGLGASLREAIREAQGEKFLIVPGDNDMPVEAIVSMLRNARKADMVMCYFLDRELRGRLRNLLSTVFGLVYATTFDVYPTYLNGPCVYPTEKLKRLVLISSRFSIVAEINTRLLRQGVSFLELPAQRQTGLEGSSSLSWRSLREVVITYLRLAAEVLVWRRGDYTQRPRRVLPDLAG
jgi:glycosyltransferase involved in cell wall biosynthesis